MALFSLTAHAADVVRVAPWELRSTFWMSLHQTLIAEATKEATLDRSKLSDSEHADWDAAVASYRTIGGEGDMTFSDPMIVASESLAEDVVPETAVGEALKRAEPIYRAHWWKPDDEANRFEEDEQP